MVQLYTNFAYDGPGAARRVKDEIKDELERAGETWSSLVSKAVEEKSWKEPPEEERTVKQLITEAEGLKKMLDDYKIGESSLVAEAEVALGANPAAPAV